MKKSKLILMMLAILFVVAGNVKAQDGSEYLLWEKTPDYSLFSFAISNDETKIAVTGSYNNDESCVLKVYDIQTGNELFSKPLTIRPTSKAQFTQDNKYFLIYGEGSNDLYDANNFQFVRSIKSSMLSFSPDNQLFIRLNTGPNLEILNFETEDVVFLQSLSKPEYGEKGSYDAFFTPNGKYIIANQTFYIEGNYSGRRVVQQIFDAKTFQKIDKTINCLKEFKSMNHSVFSNTGLCVNTFPKDEKASTQPIGFRIHDYEKDSLIWEQETKNYGSLIFLNTKNYLISKYGLYENNNPDMLVLKTWNLANNKPDKDIYCFHNTTIKLSKTDKYLCSTNGYKLWLYDFAKMFEADVSINGPQKSIEININTQPDSNLIRFTNLSSDIVSISIYDLSGNLVDLIYKRGTETNSLEYNTSLLSKGVYIVRIDTDQDSITKKIIIE